MSVQVTVNVVTAEVTINNQPIQCEVNAAPVQAEINCCGNGILGVPATGGVGDVLTKTGAGATDYEFLPAGSFSVSSIIVTTEAGEDISATRLVKIVGGIATLFEPSTDEEADGIARTSATTGNTITIVLSGRVNIAGWGLTPGAVYWAGASGTISNIDPQITRSKQVGKADDADTLILNIKESYFLN